MSTCPHCGAPVEEAASVCPRCGADVPDARADFTPPVCPNCGADTQSGADFCLRCGFDFRPFKAQQRLLDTDATLSALNGRYARQGVWRLGSGLAAALTLFLLYQTLEGNLPDALGIPAMLLFPPSLVVFLVFCCLRGVTRRRIARLLLEKTGGNG